MNDDGESNTPGPPTQHYQLPNKINFQYLTKFSKKIRKMENLANIVELYSNNINQKPQQEYENYHIIPLILLVSILTKTNVIAIDYNAKCTLTCNFKNEVLSNQSMIISYHNDDEIYYSHDKISFEIELNLS